MLSDGLAPFPYGSRGFFDGGLHGLAPSGRVEGVPSLLPDRPGLFPQRLDTVLAGGEFRQPCPGFELLVVEFPGMLERIPR